QHHVAHDLGTVSHPGRCRQLRRHAVEFINRHAPLQIRPAKESAQADAGDAGRYKARAWLPTAGPRIVRMELRHRALQVLCLADPEEKSAAALDLQAQAATLSIAEEAPVLPVGSPALPGHPERPPLLRHTDVARRSPATAQGRAVLIHAIAHIEFNAINLALDA